MVFSIHRVLVVLMCVVALLAVKPDQACASRRIDLALRPSRHILVEDSRVEEMNMKRNSLPRNNKFDPNRSSKRRVRRGSDPIHNRVIVLEMCIVKLTRGSPTQCLHTDTRSAVTNLA
ncbi:unnamed protein product, partial [Citrullus colocynthis]